MVVSRSVDKSSNLIKQKAYVNSIYLVANLPTTFTNLLNEFKKDAFGIETDGEKTYLKHISYNLLLIHILLLVDAFVSFNLLGDREFEEILKLARSYSKSLKPMGLELSLTRSKKQIILKFAIPSVKGPMVEASGGLTLELLRSTPSARLQELYSRDALDLANFIAYQLSRARVRTEMEVSPRDDLIVIKEIGTLVNSESNISLSYSLDFNNAQSKDTTVPSSSVTFELNVQSFLGQRLGRLEIRFGNKSTGALSSLMNLAFPAANNPRIYY